MFSSGGKEVMLQRTAGFPLHEDCRAPLLSGALQDSRAAVAKEQFQGHGARSVCLIGESAAVDPHEEVL